MNCTHFDILCVFCCSKRLKKHELLQLINKCYYSPGLLATSQQPSLSFAIAPARNCGKWEKTRAYKVHRIFQNTPSVQAAAFFRAPAASWSEPWLVLLTYGNKHFHHFLHIQDLQDQIHLLAFSTLCQQTSRPSKGAVSPSHFLQQAYLEEPLEK